jgi:hypothetical protein
VKGNRGLDVTPKRGEGGGLNRTKITMYQEVYLYVSLVSLFTHPQRDLHHVAKTKVH